MVKGKKFGFIYLLAIVASVAVLSYRTINEPSGLADHQYLLVQELNASNQEATEGIIFGGSNALYNIDYQSLSGKGLWKGFGAILEGGGYAPYTERIQKITDIVKSDSVESVVYITSLPYRLRELEYYMDSATNNEREKALYPRMSLLKAIINDRKGVIFRPRNYPIDDHGAIRFDAFSCRLGMSGSERGNYPDFAPASISVPYLIARLELLSDLYKDAHLYSVVSPEFYYLERGFDSLRETIKAELKESVSKNQKLKGRRITLFISDPIPAIDHTCDSRQHGNAKGREWFTQKLIAVTSGDGRGVVTDREILRLNQ